MARGLSDLQKDILKLACQNYQQTGGALAWYCLLIPAKDEAADREIKERAGDMIEQPGCIYHAWHRRWRRAGDYSLRSEAESQAQKLEERGLSSVVLPQTPYTWPPDGKPVMEYRHPDLSKEQVLEKHYGLQDEAGRVAVAKAFRRLEVRGLVARDIEDFTKLYLTAEGLRIAKELLATEHNNITDCSQ